MPQLVAYSNCDEVLITTVEEEHQLLKDYFGENNRNVEDYDREVSESGVVEVNARARVDCN